MSVLKSSKYIEKGHPALEELEAKCGLNTCYNCLMEISILTLVSKMDHILKYFFYFLLLLKFSLLYWVWLVLGIKSQTQLKKKKRLLCDDLWFEVLHSQ